MKKLILIISVFFLHNCLFAQGILVEAENFENKGGWVVDQQFMDLMGSSYLMAHGLGTPVKDAETTISIPKDGIYYAYVRTFNWTAPWHEGDGPGKFQLRVNNKNVSKALGATGTTWMWQSAGQVKLSKGISTIALHDMTGFNGRCDAIYFTEDKNDVPPSDLSALKEFRKRTDKSIQPQEDAGYYDFVVVGGGVAGMCAAVTASRLGCKVALINDRAILGGNNSSEIRVHLGGRIETGTYQELGNLIKEFGSHREGNAKPKGYYEDEKKMKFVSEEKNLDLFLNYRVLSVTKKGTNVESVMAKHIETGKEIIFRGTNFADCTGDGTVGFLAGADFMMGRESRAEFGESLAPEVADKMTMGASVQWYSKKDDKKSKFPSFKYGVTFTEQNAERVEMGEWQWETGMNLDQIKDFERVRDYGLMVIFSNWSFLKNEMKNNSGYDNRSLDWVAYIAGKRESRRLLGDYILKEDDMTKNVFHEDASATTTWTIDLHFPDPENSTKFPGNEFKSEARHLALYPYGIPYRCFYSRNVNNLFMAGRNISVTHVALGTTRVMRTTGMIGEVVGMAASLAKKFDATPREVYQYHLSDLKKLMEEGAGKKGLPNNQNYNEGSSKSEPPTF